MMLWDMAARSLGVDGWGNAKDRSSGGRRWTFRVKHLGESL